MIIDSFKIDGFWGRCVAKGKLHPDVNIFIGANGTGKTTLINILVAALRVDFTTLEDLPFKAIDIKLKRTEGSGEAPKINIQRVEKDLPYTIFEYTIDEKKYKIFSDPRRRFLLRHGRMSRGLMPISRKHETLKEVIDKLVQISWISVYRHPSVESRDDERRGFNVDIRLKELTSDLSKYQLRLENKIRDRSQKFQKEVLESLLYSKDLDDLSNFNIIRKKIKLERKNEADLILAFHELGITEKDTEIKQHFNVIRHAVRNIQNKFKNKEKPITLSDISPLPFATRTEKIVRLLTESEKDKEEIRRPIKLFLDTLHTFVTKKKFEIDISTGELVVKLIQKQEEHLRLLDLSSGEKQLLIQFLESLLQEGQPMLFFADEPELSLHVGWQEKLLPSLITLNPNSQIIVATHSPDIVSIYGEKVIHMEDIIKDKDDV